MTRPYGNQVNHFCETCNAFKLHVRGSKYYTCLTCTTKSPISKSAATADKRSRSEELVDELIHALHAHIQQGVNIATARGMWELHDVLRLAKQDAILIEHELKKLKELS